MNTQLKAIPEGVTLTQVMEASANAGRKFTYIIDNKTRFLLKDIVIGWQFHSPVNGESGGLGAGYEVAPYSVFRNTFTVPGCIKHVQIVYYVDDETRGRHFISKDAPSGSCASSRGMVLSENLALTGRVEHTDIDPINSEESA
jgi:hypothetical protein